MRKLFFLFLILMATSLQAGGPLFKHQDTYDQQEFENIYQNFTQKLSLSGGTMSGNIAMGSNKLTGLSAGSTSGDSIRYEQNKILQVLSFTATTSSTTTSSTYIKSNLSGSITPSNSNNKVKIHACFAGVTSNQGFTCDYTIARNGTNIGATSGFVEFGGAGTSMDSIAFPVCIDALDSPSSTSAVTYSVNFRNESGGITCRVGVTNTTQIMILEEVNGL